MIIQEVSSPQQVRQFLRVPLSIYRDDPMWIRPLDKDIEEVFEPKKNKSFRKGEAIRWILKDEKGNLLGRIAAFVNMKTVNRNKQPTGGTGFFECIDDQQAANRLFDSARQWLEGRGMEAMDGPVNFGERDRWWGCQVEGFHIEPNYRCNHHRPYYHKLFENYGFQEYFEQFTFSRPVQGPLSEEIRTKAERIARTPEFTFRHLEPKKLEKYAEDFLTIYNKAWATHKSVAKLRKAQVMAQFKQMKPMMDKDIIWYAYYKDEPIGFFVMLPELNQIFKYVNGKMDLRGKIKFMYHKWRGTCRKMFGMVFGIVPEFQGKGVVGAIVMAAAKHVQPLGRYDVLELNWIGDFNPGMLKVCYAVGGEIVKKHITYRKLFDPEAKFERHPVLN